MFNFRPCIWRRLATLIPMRITTTEGPDTITATTRRASKSIRRIITIANVERPSQCKRVKKHKFMSHYSTLTETLHTMDTPITTLTLVRTISTNRQVIGTSELLLEEINKPLVTIMVPMDTMAPLGGLDLVGGGIIVNPETTLIPTLVRTN